MSTIIEKLLVIQDRDRKAARLAREIKDLPDRQRMIEAQLDGHKKAVADADDAMRKKQLEQKELDAKIEANKERIQKLRQQQFEVKNNDDYRTLESQIAGLNKDIEAIEDKELILMEDLEALARGRSAREAELTTEASVVEASLAQLRERGQNLEQELAEVQADRSKLAEDIDPDWLARYERLFQNKGDYALVTVENGSCGGCHMKLPPQAAHDARKLDTMTACMYCGRLLYLIP